jgi:hypothetical protein
MGGKTYAASLLPVKALLSKVKGYQLSKSLCGFDITARYLPKVQVNNSQLTRRISTYSYEGAYKLPGFSDIPQIFNVCLLRDAERPNLGSIKVRVPYVL